MSKEKKQNKKEQAKLPIEWHVPEGLMTPFATNMLVQIIENEFKLSFFELKPAIRVDASAPLPEKVRADCVASVIITADRLPKIIEALQVQYNNYLSLKKA